jgi:glycosyltransferase involved in cell wall biosynthesis
MKLSIIIPAYNERQTIGECIMRILKTNLPEDITRELIIIDDCSMDGTWEIIQNLSKSYENVKSFRQKVNQGKGMAIRRALDEVTGDIVIIQDADLEYSPNDYEKLIKPILDGDADVVYGSRFGYSNARRVLYYKHTLGNRFLTFLSNLFTDLNLTDMETGYKVFKTSIIKSLPLRSKRFGFEPEITAKIAKRNLRIFEVPISYFGRTYQEGKKITWKDGLTAIWFIVKYYFIDDIYKEKDKKILFAMSKTHRFNKWLASYLRPHLGNIVLEIGSGIGTMPLELLPTDHYTCSDIDPIHIQRLENIFMSRPNVDVIKLNIEDEDDIHKVKIKYDTVLCINVLEHLADHTQVLRNIHKLLTKQGKIILVVPNSPFLYNSLDKILGHKRRYNIKEIENILIENGYAIRYIKTFNKISFLAWFINGNLFKRKHFGRIQLKVFDFFVWFWKRIDTFLPWPGQSIVAVAEKL